MRLRLLALAFLLATGVAPGVAPAAEAFVQVDRTPIVSKPGVGGKILRWVDRGVSLVVVRRSGEWVKLDGRRLDPPLPEAWVPAARLGPAPPGTLGAASAAGEMPADFRLVIGGLPGTPFRARCRILEAGHSRGVVLRDEAPAAFQFVGDAIECRVGNLGSGYLQTSLQDAGGAAITTGQTVAANDVVALRSAGPWGAAGSFDAPVQLVFFRDMRAPGLPPIGNPVPFIGNPVPAFRGSPVPPVVMPTPPMTVSPVPPVGMPVSPFRGSPTPPLGNPTPAFGSSPVPPFGTPVSRFRASPTPALRAPTPPLMGRPVTPLPQIR